MSYYSLIHPLLLSVLFVSIATSAWHGDDNHDHDYENNHENENNDDDKNHNNHDHEIDDHDCSEDDQYL